MHLKSVDFSPSWLDQFMASPTLNSLIIASGNLGKVAEFQDYFQRSFPDRDWQLLPKPLALEVEETGNTFLENAILKATHTAIHTRSYALADDSGLRVHALGGAPGVLSARYEATDVLRIQRLLRELDGIADTNPDRSAEFVCAIAISDPDGKIIAEAEGTCSGEILTCPRGDRGFGYDPVFYVPDYDLTFAEMSGALKNQISHRAQALKKLFYLLSQFG